MSDDISKLLGDRKADLLLMDPPYNIKKTEWDNIPQYFETFKQWILKYQSLLSEQGSFYLFHNDMPFVAKAMSWIEDNTDFVFHQFIVWNKKFKGCRNEGYLQGFNEVNGLRNYQKMAEYIMFYTFQDETGLTKVTRDMNNFKGLREYFRQFQMGLGLNKKQIIDKIGQEADHCFRWGSSQWALPTRETYQILLQLRSDIIRREYEDLRREYEEQRREYEEQRYIFNNQKTHHSIWNYEIEAKQGHMTPKPVELIKNILRYSTNENDIVLDPFLGSGSTLIACEQTNRICYGIESNTQYCQKIIERWKRETAGNKIDCYLT